VRGLLRCEGGRAGGRLSGRKGKTALKRKTKKAGKKEGGVGGKKVIPALFFNPKWLLPAFLLPPTINRSVIK
jgi:hypothetical protein